MRITTNEYAHPPLLAEFITEVHLKPNKISGHELAVSLDTTLEYLGMFGVY